MSNVLFMENSMTADARYNMADKSHLLVTLCKLLIPALGSGHSSAYSALKACRLKT